MILTFAATVAGLMAAAIAVGGFAFHAVPVLSGKRDEEVRRMTVRGGLVGFVVALFVIFLSAIVS
jgi:hypothetical protein